MANKRAISLGILAAMGVIAVMGYVSLRALRDPALRTAPLATSRPAQATRPAPPASQPRIAGQLVDLILAQDPDFPTTQPLEIPGPLSDAARIVLKDPMYLCSRRDLWIDHPHADPTAKVLVRADEEQTHILSERVRFVHWTYDNDTGKGAATLIVENNPGEWEMVTSSQRRRVNLPAGPVWKSAASWNDCIIVPADGGIAVIHAADPAKVDHVQIAQAGELPQFAMDAAGVLAWCAPGEKSSGGEGVFRYADGKWEKLTAPGFSGKILHIIPLLDGSALLLRVKVNGSAEVSLSQIEGDAAQVAAAAVDEHRIAQLVEKLSDRDPIAREQAFAELARFGPGAFAVLQDLRDAQPPGARLMINDLLNAKLEQRLGTLRLEDGPIEVISRFDDGGRVYYSEAGVSVFSENVGPQLISPAYIAVRPGRAVRLLPPLLVEEFAPQRQQMVVVADEWFITDDITGPRRFIGNHFQTVLKKNELQYWQVKGVDRRGRWYYTDPQRSATLVIDPTLPSPTPRLIVWQYPVRKGETGWTQDNWPAVKRPGAWALHATNWQPLDEEKDRFISEWTEPDPASEPTALIVPAMQPSTQPATAPTTQSQVQWGATILQETDGTRWYDGVDHLQCKRSDGTIIDWELPGVAVGGGRAQLFRVGEGRLFLFNQTGRVLAIRETPRAAEPFKVETIFTDRIPDTDAAKRIWQDPAGRIIIAIDDTLWILFPDGKVPEPIQNMMPPGLMRTPED